MTDDRAAWRYYAGAALTGIIASGLPRFNGSEDRWTKLSTQVADAMLAAEKERFSPVTPHPLAGTANDGE